MQDTTFTILSNEAIAKNSFRMVLEGCTAAISAPGQFVNLSLQGFFLRRPISVCDWEEGRLTLVYKVVGKGTKIMSELIKGDTLDILTGLGHGFDTAASSSHALLVGGGVGSAPLFALAKKLKAEGKKVTVVLGFNTAAEVMLAEDYQAIGAKLLITTMDGSMGIKGLVTDALKQVEPDYDFFYSCGPRVMMKALCMATDKAGQISMEERMGCGFGICYGCSCHTTKGAARVCSDGPVFNKEEVIW